MQRCPIGQSEVLTAAHCLFSEGSSERVPAEDIVVIAGTSNFLLGEPSEQVEGVVSTRAHPYYDPDSNSGPDTDDVGLLRLEQPMSFDNAVGSILPAGLNSFVSEGAEARLTGFGAQRRPNRKPTVVFMRST